MCRTVRLSAEARKTFDLIGLNNDRYQSPMGAICVYLEAIRSYGARNLTPTPDLCLNASTYFRRNIARPDGLLILLPGYRAYNELSCGRLLLNVDGGGGSGGGDGGRRCVGVGHVCRTVSGERRGFLMDPRSPTSHRANCSGTSDEGQPGLN